MPLRSLFAAVSGIQAHQARMDVIGSNIANVNTVGYKRARVAFQELLSQLVSGASAPSGDRGGTNAVQVGLGVQVGSITNQFTPGNLQVTGSNSDLAIEGNGFFVLGEGSNLRFTRAGTFTLDRDGSLVHPASGLIAQGWMGDATGNINTNGPLSDIQIPAGQTIPALATSEVRYAQNLDARSNGKLLYQPTPMTVTDGTSGEKAQVSVALTPTGNFNEWTYAVTAIGIEGAAVSGVAGGTGTLRLDETGAVASVSGGTATVNFSSGQSVDLSPPTVSSAGGGAFLVSSSGDTSSAPLAGVFASAVDSTATMEVFDTLGNAHKLDLTVRKVADNQWSWSASSPEPGISAAGSGLLSFDPADGQLLAASGGPIVVTLGGGLGALSVAPDFSGVSQFAAKGTLIGQFQDGFESGALESFSIDGTGTVSGVFSNGVIRRLAQLALAGFSNPAGLVKEGASFFIESRNSGSPNIGTAATAGRGRVLSGTLETSNVDLSQEFTDLIGTQRGYQANARMITASDELLLELLNIRR